MGRGLRSCVPRLSQPDHVGRKNGGLPFDEAAKEEIFTELAKDYVSGVTFSGGDPLYPANREQVGALAREVHARFPEKTIWLYTGYRWEQIADLPFLMP